MRDARTKRLRKFGRSVPCNTVGCVLRDAEVRHLGTVTGGLDAVTKLMCKLVSAGHRSIIGVKRLLTGDAGR